MSPEQASGERTVDARSDQYSLACVLYEMLAGEAPFTGPTAQAVIARRSSGEAPGVRLLRPAVARSVEQVDHESLGPGPGGSLGEARAAFARALSTPGVIPACPSGWASPGECENGGHGSRVFCLARCARPGCCWPA